MVFFSGKGGRTTRLFVCLFVAHFFNSDDKSRAMRNACVTPHRTTPINLNRPSSWPHRPSGPCGPWSWCAGRARAGPWRAKKEREKKRKKKKSNGKRKKGKKENETREVGKRDKMNGKAETKTFAKSIDQKALLPSVLHSVYCSLCNPFFSFLFLFFFRRRRSRRRRRRRGAPDQ